MKAPLTLRRVIPGLLALSLLAALAGCDGGSKTFALNFYNVDYQVSQDAAGAVTISGNTDLPEAGSFMEALIATSADPKKAQDTAVLSGSTRSPGSMPLKRAPGKDRADFTLVIANALTGTCNHQPPCGPFTAGTFYLVLDVKTPHDATAETTTYHDPRFRDQTSGFTGFPGIEIVKPIQLKEVKLKVDSEGHQVNPLTPVVAPVGSPSP